MDCRAWLFSHVLVFLAPSVCAPTGAEGSGWLLTPLDSAAAACLLGRWVTDPKRAAPKAKKAFVAH